MRFILAMLVAIVMVGCGGSTPSRIGAEYIVSTWYPFDSDKVQAEAAQAICEQYGSRVVYREGPHFWACLTPEQVVAMEQDSRVAGVGDYFCSIARDFRGTVDENVALIDQICRDYGLRQLYTPFAHYFDVQMSIKQAKTLVQDPRVEWADIDAVGGADGDSKTTKASRRRAGEGVTLSRP